MKIEQNKWNADDYANNSSAQLQWAKELIAKLSLKGDESLLDIGCGDGKITAQLASILKTGKVVGIDSSRTMIDFAQKTFPKTENPNLSFQEMDATAINLSDRFDVAFSNAVLHWIKDHVSVLKGVRDRLKSGGKILFQMGEKGNVSEIAIAINEVIKKPEWKDYFEGFVFPYSFYGTKEYETWLPENGFQPQRIELIEKDMQHQGKEGLKGWLRTTWFPYTQRVPLELRENFLNEIVDRYISIFPVDKNGFTHVKMVRLEVEAISI
ncbi:MAG: methyltransferase domain-containing protein [Prochloraceae cyanobacterium]|nr:methyltransferase domain-containing protein [Prochloraceae cyanobacterium]